MPFDAKDFVLRAGLGLEAEDRVLLGSHLVQGTHGGLLRLNSERYYQSIVWRALTPKYSVKTESGGYFDLLLTDGDKQYAFEMKRWMSSEGYSELPSIRKDIDKLSRAHSAERGMNHLLGRRPQRFRSSNAMAGGSSTKFSRKREDRAHL